MNKQELIDAVAARTGDSKVNTSEAIDAVLGAITGAVTKGDTDQLIGFGSLVHRRQGVQGGRQRGLTTGVGWPLPSAG
jgi:DNA-binding protein HU-beta